MWEEPFFILILLAHEDRQESVVMSHQNQDPLIGIEFGQPFEGAKDSSKSWVYTLAGSKNGSFFPAWCPSESKRWPGQTLHNWE
ncbi:hypothetical protein N7490_000831 [Penicillium lividum]|nr:hypothetical protein N7490_000831 [Penicillium lividum]